MGHQKFAEKLQLKIFQLLIILYDPMTNLINELLPKLNSSEQKFNIKRRKLVSSSNQKIEKKPIKINSLKIQDSKETEIYTNESINISDEPLVKNITKTLSSKSNSPEPKNQPIPITQPLTTSISIPNDD